MIETTTLTQWPESRVMIRFSDCDLFGHLGNVWYVKYFLDAREEHLQNSYGFTVGEFAKQGVGWVVSANQIAYFRPAFVNEQVIIRSAIVEFSASQILVEMQMWDAKRTHIKSAMWTNFVHVGMKDGRRIDHSAELLNMFTPLVAGPFGDGNFATRMQELKAQKSFQTTSNY